MPASLSIGTNTVFVKRENFQLTKNFFLLLRYRQVCSDLILNFFNSLHPWIRLQWKEIDSWKENIWFTIALWTVFVLFSHPIAHCSNMSQREKEAALKVSSLNGNNFMNEKHIKKCWSLLKETSIRCLFHKNFTAAVQFNDRCQGFIMQSLLNFGCGGYLMHYSSF